MTGLMQDLAGMGSMTDQVIATDFLLASKTGVKDIAIALTETSTPELRETLKQFLNDAIITHEQIFKYMVAKGYYHPNNVVEQLQVDLKAAQTALDIAQE